MRVLISLAVHEEPTVVLGQLRNIHWFLRDPVVIVHVSADFDVDVESLRLSERVIINPNRFPTAWGTGILLRVHLSNVRHALARTRCDYVAFHSSNDLFVRPGVEDYMDGQVAGFTKGEFEPWGWRGACRRDEPLGRYLKRNALPSARVAQTEGSFYRRERFEEMLESLEGLHQEVPWEELSVRYPREEVYLPTALAACGWRPSAAGYTYVNWDRGLTLSVEEVDAIRAGDYDALPDFTMAPGQELYCVKRVPRRCDDPIRCYIEALETR